MKHALTIFLLIITSGMTLADPSKELAEKIAKAGSIAAKFKEVSKGTVSEAEVEKRFGYLGGDILKSAQKWAKDGELKDSPPAFRRFLLFDYISENTDVVAGASNPDNLLINVDAAVDVLFEDKSIAKWAKSQMTQETTSSKFKTISGRTVGVFPMIPSDPSKAKSCIACHASDEVGRPYPKNAKVLGYTFVSVPK